MTLVALERNPVTVVHWMVFPGPGSTRSVARGEAPASYVLRTVEQVLRDPYFGGIEVTRIKDPDVRRQVREMAIRYGKRLYYGAQPVQLVNEERWIPPTDIASANEVHRRQAAERLLRCVDEAYELGAVSLSLLSGRDPGDSPGNRLRQEATEALVRSLAEICRYARERAEALGREPLWVVLESFDRRTEPGFRNMLIGPSTEALAVARIVRAHLGHFNFGLLYDLSHMRLLKGPGDEEETPDAIRLLAPFLVHVHIGSAVLDPTDPLYGDSHPRLDYPASAIGEEQLAGFLSALVDVGYQGPIGLEVVPRPGELSEAVLTSTRALYDVARERLDVNYTLGSFYWHTRRFFTDELWQVLAESRVRRAERVEEAARARRRPDGLTPADGRLLVLAADHPARRVTSAGDDPVALGDRLEYLGRILRVLSSPLVDGVMATPDVVDELLLVDWLVKQHGHQGLLDGRLIVGSMNRSGLAGVEYEMEDRLTAFTPEAIQARGLDAGKLLLRIDPGPYSRYSIQTMSYVAQAASSCRRLGLPVFLEVLPVERVEGRYRVRLETEEMIRAVGVAAGIGEATDRLWLKIPYVPDFYRVARATTLPILLLGGEVLDSPVALLEDFERGMAAGPNVRGAMVGRNVLFPGRDDPRAVAEAISLIIHQQATAADAVRHLVQTRGAEERFLVERLSAAP
ncbi:MAG: TIM barrel protein [Firmicutes bacterium]|nr:TIM barrel protein [Bacillota bacterium]